MSPYTKVKMSLDRHRPLSDRDDLTHVLTWQETCILSKNITIRFNKVVYQIQTQPPLL